MKFRNETSENIKYRTGTYKGYDWHTARPGQIVELPQMLGTDLGLARVNNDVRSTKKDSENDDTILLETQDETGVEEYKKRLIDVDGVGKKTAEDIMGVYPTEADLKKGISEGEEIHKRDDVDEKVKAEFGGAVLG